MTIETTLAEREARYGSFTGHAALSQNLTKVMHAAPKWGDLSDTQKEALEMIAHKIARILNGDPGYGDNWHDVAGYATLVENELGPTAVQELDLPPIDPDLLAIAGVRELGHWLCTHGGQHLANSKRVPVGEACPVCYATK